MKKYWIISLFLLAFDQASKLWASSRLVHGAIDVWPGVFRFRYARNTGAAFSMFNGNAAILAGVTAALLAVVAVLYFREKSLRDVSRGGLTFIIAGGMGNLIDRLIRGYVVDFIEPVFIDFAIFNVADVAVCLGAFLVALGALMKEGKKNALDG